MNNHESQDDPKLPIDNDITLSKEAIATRAYEHYLARGGQHGLDEDDWLKAETELREEALRMHPREPVDPASATGAT